VAAAAREDGDKVLRQSVCEQLMGLGKKAWLGGRKCRRDRGRKRRWRRELGGWLGAMEQESGFNRRLRKKKGLAKATGRGVNELLCSW